MTALALAAAATSQTDATSDIGLSADELLWLREHPVIRVGPAFDYRPIEWVDEQGRLRGVTADYLDHFAKTLGVRFEIVNVSRAKRLSGDPHDMGIDVEPLTGPTATRTASWSFTRPYLNTRATLVVRADRREDPKLEEFGGRRLAVVANGLIEQILTANYPKILVEPVPDLPAGFAAVSDERVDAFLCNSAVANRRLGEGEEHGLRVVAGANYDYGLGLGVRKDWPELVQILQKALDALSATDRDRFSRRWIPWSPVEDRNLVFVGDRFHRPFVFLEDDVPSGLHIEVLDELMRLLGRKSEVHLLPWGEPNRRFRRGEGDAVLSMIATEARRAIYDFSDPIGHLEIALFVRRGSSFRGPADLRSEPIAVSRNTKWAEVLGDLGFTDLREVKRHSEGFDMVMRGEASAVAATVWSTMTLLREQELDLELLGPPVHTVPLMFGVRKGNARLLAELNRGIAYLRESGKLTELTERWKPVRATALNPAPSFVERTWRIPEGLPQDCVNAIVRDRAGFLWLGTFGGLVRYDGARFDTFTVNDVDSLPSNRVTALFEDLSGTLWVGTQHNGLLRHVNGELEPIEWAGKRPLGMVRDIAQTSDGQLIVLGDDLARLEHGRLVPIQVDDDAGAMLTLCVRDREVWVGAADRTLRDHGNGFEAVFDDPDGATAITCDESGRIYVGTHRRPGVWQLDDGRWKKLPGFDEGVIKDLMVDSSDRLWIATSNGLWLSETIGELPVRLPAEPVLDMDIKCVIEDVEGRFWVGTSRKGLIQLQPTAVTQLALEGSAWSITGDSSTGLWIAHDYGVMRLGRNGIEKLPGIGKNNGVRSLAVDGEGMLWIGGYRPLGRFDGRTETRFGESHGLGAECQIVHVARDGTLWVCAGHDVGRFVDDRFERVVTLEAAPKAVTDASDGAIWVGTTRGIVVWRNGRTIEYGPAKGMPVVPVRALHEDDTGTMWVATYGRGLVRIDGDRVVHYSSANGLANDSLQGVAVNEHEVWLNSNRGPFRVARSELDAYADGAATRVSCEAFGGVEGNGAATALRGSDERIWFVNTEGVSVVDPAKIRSRSKPPPVVMEQVLVNGEVADPDPVERRIVVPAGDNEIEFRYAGLDLSEPQLVNYRYRLSGHQSSWYEAGKARAATYSSIPPGDYVFFVQASSTPGSWSNAANVYLQVRPAIYQSLWFIVATILCGAALLYSGHRYRLTRVQRQSERLEALVGDRTAELRSTNRELNAFTYTVSHDLRAPLRHIGHYAQRLHDELGPDALAVAQSSVDGIARSSQRMSRLIDDLLTLSRLARKDVVRTDVDTSALVEEVWRDLERVAPSPSHELEAGPLPRVQADEKLLRHVWHNLLENARKYSAGKDSPRVAVSAEHHDGRLWFVVEDNGVGFDQNYANKLFVAFERLHSQEEFTGSGVGLAICERMVAKHGGAITGEGIIDEGAVFRFTLDPTPASRG